MTTSVSQRRSLFIMFLCIVLALLVLAWWFIVWLLRRMDYAPVVQSVPASAAAGLMRLARQLG